ncbi:MAG TPA: ABC transporter substrate-binding protein [Bacteroidales bacterium]|nr:ABC transporter substrate-binding protein [Bacteroidales bacterium]
MKRILILPDVANKICNASLVFLLTIITISCQGKKRILFDENSESGERVVVSAKGFSIVRNENYSVVSIKNPWQGAEGVRLVHYLVKRGTPLPPGIDSGQVIFVPVESIVCMSTTHVGMIVALGKGNAIKGLSGAGLVYDPEISIMVNKGFVSEVGYETSMNQELIIKLSPDIVMMYGIGSESAGHVNKIRELGIKIMFNGDYLETDPLSKAEWIKLFGVLFCREKLADSIFNEEMLAYGQIRNIVKNSKSAAPSVLLGLPFKDTWFVSPGNSFISKLIEDAGGNYLWKNTVSAFSMPYGLENVYIAAMNADYWLNIGTASRSDEITMVDKRLADLKCFKNRNLYNNNKRVNQSGGNDYWESGALRPHLILKDMASILHPELFPDHELFYYQKIN